MTQREYGVGNKNSLIYCLIYGKMVYCPQIHHQFNDMIDLNTHISPNYHPGVILTQAEPLPIKVQMTGGGKNVLMDDTAPLWWILSTTTKLAFYHGGREVSSLSTRNDFPGYLTSFLGLEEDIKYIKARYGIDDNSTMELRATTRFTATPCVERPAEAESNRVALQDSIKLKLVEASRLDLYVAVTPPTPPIEHFPARRQLKELTLCEVKSYSSLRDNKANLAAKEELKKIWSATGEKNRYANDHARSFFREAFDKFVSGEDLIDIYRN